MLGQPRTGFQMPHDNAAVALGDGAGLGERLSSLPLSGGGKIRAGIRPRSRL
jgi:hypothetical protein